jgi:hypothetical protein
MPSRTLAAAALLAAVATPGRAAAETTPTSTISQVKVVEANDPKYRLFHGAIWLQVDKATHNYRWGGRNCDNASLSAENLALLFSAFHAGLSVSIDFQSVTFREETFRCISGFTVTR